MTIMPNIVAKAVRLPIRAFTLLESLVTLGVVVLITLSLSGSVTGLFQDVENHLFYLRFEYLYRDCQRLAATKGDKVELNLSSHQVSSESTKIAIPKNIRLDRSYHLEFDAKGGNSSLVKISFTSKKEVVSYQLNMGSGKYKKTVT